jgi:hypothetical protein
VVRQIQEQSRLHVTASAAHPISDGRLQIKVRLAGNGANFLIISPGKKPPMTPP